MSKISNNTRLILALIVVILVFLGLFFFTTSLLKFYKETPTFPIVETSLVLIGSLMIFIGFKGFNRNSPKKCKAD